MHQFEPRATILLVEAKCDDALLAGRPRGIPAVAHEFRWTDLEVFTVDGAGDLLWDFAIARWWRSTHDYAIAAADTEVGFGFDAGEVRRAHPTLHLFGIGPGGEDALARGAEETVDVDVQVCG